MTATSKVFKALTRKCLGDASYYPGSTYSR